LKNNVNIHIITGLSGGGAEHLVLELSKQAKLNNVKPLVISVSSLDEIAYKFESNEIDFTFLNIDGFKDLIKGLKKLHSLLEPYGKNTTVHAHMFHALFTLLLFRLRFFKKCTIIFTLHNNSVSSLLRRILLFITKPFRDTDIIFSNNSDKWYLKNNAVIPNGIDLERFAYTLPEPRKVKYTFDFIFLGSLTEQKNPLILPQIANKLIKAGETNFVIHVVGDGPLRKNLEALIKVNNLEKYIILHGFKNNIPKLLMTYHCQIMPSLWEGMPISLLESGACGLPIITTPVGSIPDFLNNDNAALSDPENFDVAMKEVIIDYDLAVAKANIFRDYVIRNYAISAIYQQHQKVYTSN